MQGDWALVLVLLLAGAGAQDPTREDSPLYPHWVVGSLCQVSPVKPVLHTLEEFHRDY